MAPYARDRLARLYMPQVEQFGIELEPRGQALVGSIDNETARAEVCVYRIEDCCCVTSHRIRMRRSIPFQENRMLGLCVCTLSADSLSLSPVAQPTRPHPSGNVAVFGNGSAGISTRLLAGSRQDAISITFLPEWFARLEVEERRDMRRLIEEPGSTWPDDLAPAVNTALGSITPLFGGSLASEDTLSRTTRSVALGSLAWYRERSRAEEASGTRAQARLVRTAQRHIAQHLDMPLSLDALARDLLTSRSRLCAAFKAETGMSVGAYVRWARMERAAELLERTPLDVADIAREVGYGRPSSFTVAFERAFGHTPTAARGASGGGPRSR